MTNTSMATAKLRYIAAAAAAIVTSVIVGLAIGLPSTASAHDTSTCTHNDISNGGWYLVYLGHYTDSRGRHYNVYAHYLNGVYQHDEANRCN